LKIYPTIPKIVFAHLAFSDIPPSEYFRLIIDGKLQRNPEEHGWVSYEIREGGSVKSLLRAYAFMLGTVNTKPISEELIKEFQKRVFEDNDSATIEYVAAGDYEPRTGTINTETEDITEAGLEMLKERERKGQIRLMIRTNYDALQFIDEEDPLKDGERYAIRSLSEDISEDIKKYVQVYYDRLGEIEKKNLDEEALKKEK
jgi:hypothetical protein